jgi:hypothetical protein
MYGPSYLDEIEKLAAVPSPLKVGLGSAALAALAVRAAQRPQERTDQMVHAVGGMSKADLQHKRRVRAAVTALGAATAGTAAGFGLKPATRKASEVAGRFVANVAKPTMTQAEDLAGRASKRLGDDVASALVARGADAGRNFSTGLQEKMTPSLLRRLFGLSPRG